MIPTLNEAIITADGQYRLYPETPGREVQVEWHITAGTADVTPGYMNLAGGFSPLLGLDGQPPVFAASGGICRVGVPNSGYVALKVESAAGLSMVVCQNRVK